jgi:site-specific DNA-methyltransferase (adenine-specific)
VFVASNAFILPLLLTSLIDGGLEFRGQIMRLVRTLRGGDRPKNAEQEFPFVCSLPRGCYEPWVLFRKPMPCGMKVSDALREFQTGGLRRLPDGNPFEDVIASERTPKVERMIADHPSLKPQSLMRLLAYVALPLGEGVIVDPFAGSGSTIAAAEAVGVAAFGIERHRPYFDMAKAAVPRLATLPSRADAIVGRADSPRLFDRKITCGGAALAAE